MTSYTVFNERRNYTPNPYTVIRNKLNVMSGDINIEGSRAVDNAKFIAASPVDVKIGDIISCVADDIDTSELIGAWNFYHNLRDESGYNLDATVTGGTLVYARETLESSRFRGHPYVDFNASSSPVVQIVPSTSENNSTIINFDNDSSIVIWCKTPTSLNTTGQILFDRSTTNQGLQIGLKKDGTKYYAFLRVKGSGGNWVESIKNTNVEISLVSDLMISVVKDDSPWSEQYEIRINGGVNGNPVTWSGDIEASSPPPIKLGLSSAGSQYFQGRLYSVRLYTKEISSGDETILFKRKQPFTTMKFAGKVVRVDDGNSVTNIEVSGFSSELLLKTELTKEFSTYLSSAGSYKYTTASSPTDAQKEETLLENIIADLISAVNANVLDADDIKYEFVYDNVDDDEDNGGVDINGNATTLAWKYKTNQFHVRNLNILNIRGKLVSLTQILAILGGKEFSVASTPTLIHNGGADSFFMLPRKILIYESSEIDSNTSFSFGRYNIVDGGYSSNTVYNDISLFGKGELKYHNFYFSVDPANIPTSFYDLNGGLGVNRNFMGIIQTDAFHDPHYFKQLRYNSTSSNVDDSYHYDNVTGFFHYNLQNTYIDTISLTVAYLDLTNSSAALTSLPAGQSKTYYYQVQSNPSIEKYGKRSKKFYYPMLEDMTTTGAVCRRLLGSNHEKHRKAQIIIPHLSNSIQIGSKVSITNDLKKIYNEELTVKSINYKFPDFKTIVNIGDYSYNFIDNMSQVVESVNSKESELTGVT